MSSNQQQTWSTNVIDSVINVVGNQMFDQSMLNNRVIDKSQEPVHAPARNRRKIYINELVQRSLPTTLYCFRAYYYESQ